VSASWLISEEVVRWTVSEQVSIVEDGDCDDEGPASSVAKRRCE